MLDWEFSSEKSLPFSTATDASSLCAPLQQYPSHHAAPSTTKSCRQNSPSMAQGGTSRRVGPVSLPPSANVPSTNPTASWVSSNDGSPTAGAGSTVRSSTSPATTATDPSPVLIHNILNYLIFITPAYHPSPSLPIARPTPTLPNHPLHLPAWICWQGVGGGSGESMCG